MCGSLKVLVNGLACLVTVCLHGSNLDIYAQPEKDSSSRDTAGISFCLIKWNMSSNKKSQETVHVNECLTYSVPS